MLNIDYVFNVLTNLFNLLKRKKPTNFIVDFIPWTFIKFYNAV